MEQKKSAVQAFIEGILGAGAFIGAGAVSACILKTFDLSTIKGIAKICTGIGVIGISHAVGNSAAEAIRKDVGTGFQFVNGYILPNNNVQYVPVQPVNAPQQPQMANTQQTA